MIRLYNTMTMKKEEFIPLEPGKVRMYNCGPTVYDLFHVGNARPLVTFDALRRYLEYRGYEVTYVQNFTDIDDKIIGRANEEGLTCAEITEKFMAEYWTDARGLGVMEAAFHPKATDHVGEITGMISKLIGKGLAYRSGNDVYYRISGFPGYGKLSRQPMDELIAGARVDVTEKKESPMDFALWKGAKPGEPFWDSPWGRGRPGWHIECSAMIGKLLGETIDIHCGGRDLVFPHHENEIAQSEGCYGGQFVRYWLHNGLISIDSRKMSKSLGNFFTVREAAAAYGYENIRMFILMSHYRSPLNYSGEVLEQSKKALERLKTAKATLEHIAASPHPGESGGSPAGFSGAPSEGLSADPAANLSAGSTVYAVEEPSEGAFLESLPAYKERFCAALDDDFNTADAVSVIFEMVRQGNSIAAGPRPTKEFADATLEVLCELAGVLGLFYAEAGAAGIDEDVKTLIDARQAARKEKNWAESDRIRDELTRMGITLEDTPQGVKWKRGGAARL